uniref:Uncharacterized protein n=1 Tax=Brassica oleracea TaxID=3712 RepID=A0A3P6DVN7_BRAOL|nr:unnamed protein product [Brassica oleracea]
MIGGLLETHVKQENLATLMSSSFPGWSFDSNHSPEAENGRIVVIWNSVLSVMGAIYFNWRERNSRLHSGVNKPATQIVKEIQVQIRAKLLGMDKENSLSYQVRSRTQESFIATWFDQFQA